MRVLMLLKETVSSSMALGVYPQLAVPLRHLSDVPLTLPPITACPHTFPQMPGFDHEAKRHLPSDSESWLRGGALTEGDIWLQT